MYAHVHACMFVHMCVHAMNVFTHSCVYLCVYTCKHIRSSSKFKHLMGLAVLSKWNGIDRS